MDEHLSIDEQHRLVGDGASPHPQAVVWRLMHEQARQLDRLRDSHHRSLAAERRRLAELLVQVGDVLYELWRFAAVHRAALESSPGAEAAAAANTIITRLDQVFAQAGARLEVPGHEPYAAEMAWWVRIVTSVPDDVSVSTVKDVLAPAVYRGDELLRPALAVLAVPGGSGEVRE